MPTDRDTQRNTDSETGRQTEGDRERDGRRLRLRREGEKRDRDTERMEGERGC